MKFTKLSLLIASLVLVADCAMAQSFYDIFGSTRATALAPGSALTGIGGTTAPQTNNWVDIRNLTGIGTVVINVGTNTGTAGTLTFGIESSIDQTNTTAISYAIGTNSTAIYTNNTYSSVGLKATNNYTFPGTVVYPSAGTAGFATPYLAPSPMTNTGTFSVAAGGTYTIGFKLDDAQRYVHVWWTPSGQSATNATVSATLISRGIQNPL